MRIVPVNLIFTAASYLENQNCKVTLQLLQQLFYTIYNIIALSCTSHVKRTYRVQLV